MTGDLYGLWAPVYRELGYSARPCLGKQCKEKKWQLADSDLPPNLLDNWLKNRREYNIGLRTSTIFPDGTLFGALDIDSRNNRYVDIARVLLKNPVSGRIGSKGAVFFFRYFPLVAKPQLQYKVGKELIAELLLTQLVIIPPSIHPDTEQPYQWIGKPLHEVDYHELPLIGE